MVDFTDRLDRYLRQPKDITGFSLANSNILKDIKVGVPMFCVSLCQSDTHSIKSDSSETQIYQKRAAKAQSESQSDQEMDEGDQRKTMRNHSKETELRL